MKALFQLSLFILLTGHTFAQKCDFSVNQYDPVTGKSKKQVMTPITNQFIMLSTNEYGTYRMGIEITLFEIRKSGISKGDTLNILLSDNEVITAFASDKYIPLVKSDARAEVSQLFPYYNISNSDWEKLIKANVSAMRVNIGAEYVSIEVEESKAKKLRQAVQCVK